MTRRLSLAAVFTLLMISSAAAHTGAGDAAGFSHGIAHPFSGLDHILAMIAVGLFAAGLGGRALYLVPASFVGVMTVGGILGAGAIAVPLVEFGIALSVIVLGIAVAIRWRLPTPAAMALVGFFAIFHGHAHGAEMPADSSGLAYAAGFLIATAILHGVGISLGISIGSLARSFSRPIVQLGGGAMALSGVGILAGIL